MLRDIYLSTVKPQNYTTTVLVTKYCPAVYIPVHVYVHVHVRRQIYVCKMQSTF